MFAVSCTTRPPRTGEEHGREYYFLSHEDFDSHVKADDFVEWEQLHANRYGTLKSEIERLRALGQHVLLDLDVKGALNARERLHDVLLVFIAPPSIEVLEQRLRARATDSEEQIAIRLQRVQEEMALADRFDTCVVNDNLEEAVDRLAAILQERMNNANCDTNHQ